MPSTIAQALAWAKEALTVAGSESPSTDARLLLAHCLGKNQTYLYTWSDKTLSEGVYAQFSALIDARVRGEPVAYLLGYRDFWTLRLAVNSSTLIPRPETELLVENALARLSTDASTLCDLGTGTGAVALALASERPDITVTGVDKVADAVQLAKQNAKLNQLSNVQFLQSDWFAALGTTKFDMIVSNPPYVEENSPYLHTGDVRFEPRSALTSGLDGLEDIRRIIHRATAHLQADGWLLLEHGYPQGSAIRSLFKAAGYCEVETIQDLAGLDRITLGKYNTCE